MTLKASSSIEPAPIISDKAYTSTATLHNNFTTADNFQEKLTYSSTKDYNITINKSTTKLTRVDSFDGNDSENKEEDIQHSELVQLDAPIRYSLMIVGTLSGPAIFFKIRWLRIVSGLFNALLSVILLAGLTAGFLFAWDEPEDSDLDRLVRSLATLIITGWLAIQCSAFFVISQLKCGLIKYYQQLSKVEECLTKLGVTIRVKRIRWFVRIITILSWVFAIGNCGIRVLDFKDPEYDDAMLGTQTENTASPLQILLIKLLSRAALAVVTLHWVYGQAYFASICVMLWVLLLDYNKCLEKDIEKSPAQVFQNLEAYRRAHLDLCDLVEQVDTLFRFKFGILIGGNTLILLCILYLASVAANYPHLYDFGRYFYYIVMAGAALVIIIFFCHKVFNEVRKLILLAT